MRMESGWIGNGVPGTLTSDPCRQGRWKTPPAAGGVPSGGGLGHAGLILAAALSLGGCAATQPGSTALPALPQEAREIQAVKPLVTTGAPFRHLILTHPDLEPPEKERGELHVYLEGDGRPWLTRQQIASDPTGSDLLALRLMARDPVQSIYVGRPCYHGFAADPGCRPWLWTHGRYSPEVVATMVAAIRSLLPQGPRSRITLIGYSGGGVLAILMAPQLEGVVQVITIGANLDTDAWADHHGYSPLVGSLNPARQTPLEGGIRQLHLVGDQDARVPLASIATYLARNPKASLRVLAGFDHRCCWLEQWPQLLKDDQG